nr:hypothetical protein [uncultured Mucilaginibacter sp.]
MLLNRFLPICFAIVFTLASCQKDYSKADLKGLASQTSINFIPAKTSAELLSLRNQKSANIIRTLEDFDAAVLSRSTPLSKLSSDQILDFKNSLTIKPGTGIVSLQYSVLKSALSYDDFAGVMVFFGIDIKQGYWGLSNDPVIQAKLRLSNNMINSTNSVDNSEHESLVGGVAGMDYICQMTTSGMSCIRHKGSLCDGCN